MGYNESKIPVIALDGNSGAGKGTIGLRLAHFLKWHYLDSGVFYRLLAWEADRQSISFRNESTLAQIASALYPSFQMDSAAINGLKIRIIWREQDLTSILRTELCGLQASQIAGYPLVRKALLEAQRRFRCMPGLIADGRDMGNVVFPDSIYKFFLTASVEARIKRRQKQLKQYGNYVSLSAIKKTLVQRDNSDSARLTATTETCIIDTTYLSIAQVIAVIEEKLSTIGLYFY